MRKLGVLACAALSAAALVVPATSAEALTGCLESNRYDFSPALGLNIGTGSANLTVGKTCVTASPLGVKTYDNTLLGRSYFGNCAAALLTEGTASVLIGGSVNVMVEVGSPDYVKVGVLVPSAFCPAAINSASGPAVLLWN